MMSVYDPLRSRAAAKALKVEEDLRREDGTDTIMDEPTGERPSRGIETRYDEDSAEVLPTADVSAPSVPHFGQQRVSGIVYTHRTLPKTVTNPDENYDESLDDTLAKMDRAVKEEVGQVISECIKNATAVQLEEIRKFTEKYLDRTHSWILGAEANAQNRLNSLSENLGVLRSKLDAMLVQQEESNNRSKPGRKNKKKAKLRRNRVNSGKYLQRRPSLEQAFGTDVGLPSAPARQAVPARVQGSEEDLSGLRDSTIQASSSLLSANAVRDPAAVPETREPDELMLGRTDATPPQEHDKFNGFQDLGARVLQITDIDSTLLEQSNKPSERGRNSPSAVPAERRAALKTPASSVPPQTLSTAPSERAPSTPPTPQTPLTEDLSSCPPSEFRVETSGAHTTDFPKAPAMELSELLPPQDSTPPSASIDADEVLVLVSEHPPAPTVSTRAIVSSEEDTEAVGLAQALDTLSPDSDDHRIGMREPSDLAIPIENDDFIHPTLVTGSAPRRTLATLAVDRMSLTASNTSELVLSADPPAELMVGIKDESEMASSHAQLKVHTHIPFSDRVIARINGSAREFYSAHGNKGSIRQFVVPFVVAIFGGGALYVTVLEPWTRSEIVQRDKHEPTQDPTLIQVFSRQSVPDLPEAARPRQSASLSPSAPPKPTGKISPPKTPKVAGSTTVTSESESLVASPKPAPSSMRQAASGAAGNCSGAGGNKVSVNFSAAGVVTSVLIVGGPLKGQTGAQCVTDAVQSVVKTFSTEPGRQPFTITMQ